MTVSLVVFDMAGTTVHDDDGVNACLRRTLGEFGIGASRDDVNTVMGEPKPVAIAKLLTHVRKAETTTTDRDVVEIYKRFQALMLTHYRHDTNVRAVDGAIDAFRELKDAGVRIALDTGFSRVIVDTILARLHWMPGNLIDATVASDEVRRGRPYPDLIERAMALTGVTDAHSVAKVGDTPADLLSGDAAGCGWIVGVTTGTHTRAQLEPFPHSHIVERLIEIPRVLSERRMPVT